MSHQSDISSLSRLGDNDDEMLTEKKLQTQLSHLLTKKTLSDTPKNDSTSTFPYDRELYPNECFLIFFSLERDTGTRWENRDIKLSRETFVERETPSFDNDILIRFELNSFRRSVTELNIECRPFSRFDLRYNNFERCPSRIKELIEGVSKDDKIQIEVDENFPFITETTPLILEQPWSEKISLGIDRRKLHSESRTKLSVYLINSLGETKKQFDVPLEVFSFPFRVKQSGWWRPIYDYEVLINHKVEVYIHSDEELQQLFQVFSERENFILSHLSLFPQQINFTVDEIEKWEKLKCRVERLYLRFKSANVHVLRKILEKIGPVCNLHLNIESLSNYVDSPFQASIPFKFMLEQVEHLKTIDISDLTTPILMDYF